MSLNLKHRGVIELNDLLVTILNTVEMSQALSIGLFLLFLNRTKKNSLLFLSFFLIVSGLASLSEIFETVNTYIQSPYLELLPLGFFPLLPSLLYVYLGEISIIKNKNTNYYILFPGLIEFVVNTIIYFLPLELKQSITDSVPYILFELAAVLFGLFIIILTFKKVRKHSKLLKDQYSSVERRELNWLLVAITSVIIFFILSGIAAFYFSDFVNDIFGSVFGISLVYWTSYHGLLQQTSDNLINEKNNDSKPINDINIDSGQSEKEQEKHKQVIEKVDTLLHAESLYLNPELTIVHISERVNEHPRLVSAAINKLSQQNFNSYINKYRVEKAKIMLLAGKTSQLNIEGVGLEAGFKSNSAFYTAFKKFQKITPLQFLQNSES